MSYLEVRNLSKRFGDVVALDNVSADFNKGEIVCLLGPSGNGKTTFLRCLVDLYTPDEGTITLNGKQIFPLCKGETRPNIGMVFQNYNLFPQYNALENITLALNLNAKGKDKKQLKAKNDEIALELLEKMQLKDKAKSYPFQLSGGQKQRLAIARALALNPELILFDEPTSALDPKTTIAVRNIIKSLKKEKTIIIVTHDIEFAKTVSDKIYFILEGKINLTGTTKEVFASKKHAWLNFLGSVKEEEENAR